jgi:hypothetical protein
MAKFEHAIEETPGTFLVFVMVAECLLNGCLGVGDIGLTVGLRLRLTVAKCSS